MTTGNLPIQAFSAVVTPEQGYKVTVNFGAGFDLTNAAVRVYQRSKQLTAGVPNLAVTGQQIVITYSVEQLTELRKAASVTQHHIYLPNMLYTTRVGWEITVVNKFSDAVQVESLLGVTLGEDGETIAVSISGADVVAGLVAQAEAAADDAETARDEFFDALPVRVASYAAMVALLVEGQPRKFTVINDEELGVEKSQYEWDGVELFVYGTLVEPQPILV